MKLKINTKKIASLIIAGGIGLNATMIDTKAPTIEDAITMKITNNINNRYGKNILKDTDVDVYYNGAANSVSYSTPNLASINNQRIYEEIINLIGEPNYDELTLINETPIYATKTDTTYTNEIDGEIIKVITDTKEEKYIYGYKKYYIDPSAEEYFNEKYPTSKVKQK